MRKIRFAVLAAAVTLPLLLWPASQGFGLGEFQKPGIPQGAKVQGPAGKGTITYIVNQNTSPVATIEFHGQCTIGNGSNAVTKQIDTQKLDVSLITDPNAFATGTAKAIAAAVESFFTDNPIAVVPLNSCWPGAFGVFVQAVNSDGTKTTVPSTPFNIYVWTGDSTLKGVFH